MDIRTSSETDVIKCFVGTDNYQGGVVGGEACIAVLDELGQIGRHV